MNKQVLDLIAQLTEDRVKANRPAYSVELSKSKSAQELGKKIADSWLGYGLQESSQEQAGGGYRLSIKTDMKKFDDAMRFLWFKGQGDDAHKTYTMMGLPYTVDVTVNGKQLDLTINPTNKTTTPVA